MKNKDNELEFTLPSTEICYKTRVTKTIWYQHIKTWININNWKSRNRPNIHDMWQSISHIVNDKGYLKKWGKDELFKKRYFNKWAANWEKLSWTHTSHQKNSKWIKTKRLKMKHKKYFKKPQDHFSYTSTRGNLSMYDREPRSLKKSIKNQFFS